jgi:hypothetical protein
MGTAHVHQATQVEGEERDKDKDKGDETPAPAPGEVAERLAEELARLRARSAVDPAVARRSLAPAWIGPAAGVEDDEAEFLDAMADCLGAGLSLDKALACWHAGDLAYDPGDAEESDEPSVPVRAEPSAHHGPGRRLLVR